MPAPAPVQNPLQWKPGGERLIAAELKAQTVSVPYPPGSYASSAHRRMTAVSHAHFCAAQAKAFGCHVQRKRQIEKKIKKNIASLRRGGR